MNTLLSETIFQKVELDFRLQFIKDGILTLKAANLKLTKKAMYHLSQCRKAVEDMEKASKNKPEKPE